MSTTPVVPAQPNAPSYPLSALYIYTDLVSQAGYKAAFGLYPPAVNNTRPTKRWVRPAQPGEDQSDYVTFTVWDGATGTKKVPMTIGDAAAVNILPDSNPTGDPNAGTPSEALPTTSFPMRSLLPNEVIVPTPFGVTVQRTDMQPNAGDSANIQAILAAVNAIRAKLGA